MPLDPRFIECNFVRFAILMRVNFSFSTMSLVSFKRLINDSVLWMRLLNGWCSSSALSPIGHADPKSAMHLRAQPIFGLWVWFRKVWIFSMRLREAPIHKHPSVSSLRTVLILVHAPQTASSIYEAHSLAASSPSTGIAVSGCSLIIGRVPNTIDSCACHHTHRNRT